MNLKEKLTQLNTEFTALKTKIKTKLATDKKSLSETIQKLNESQHKLELSFQENRENEKVLEQLEKEFKELAQELE